jgi:hypothetical protein
VRCTAIVVNAAAVTILMGTQSSRAQPSGPPTPNPALIPPRVLLSYPAGWNLVSGAVAAYLVGFLPALRELYTLQAGGDAYQTIALLLPNAGVGIDINLGYWVFLAQPEEASLLTGGGVARQVPAAAGQFVMIGNPYGVEASVSGADIIYVYDPETGKYQQTDTLQPGQGAFAYSATGGTIRVH